MAHAAGALVLIDGAQAVPHVPVDVQALGADFYAFSGHKMLAPMGSGALWARRELLEAMPPFLAGGEMIREVHLRRSDYNDIPWKFEAGTPAVGDAIGLGVAAEYLSAIGMDAVREHERDLVAYSLETLKAKVPGIELYGPMDPDLRGGVVPFNLPGIHPHDVAQVLDRLGHRRPRRAPLHDASPRAPRPRRDGAGLVQRLLDPRRHRRPRRRPARRPAGVPHRLAPPARPASNPPCPRSIGRVCLPSSPGEERVDTMARLRVRGFALFVAVVIAACGGPAPQTTAGPSGPGSATAAPSGSAGPSFTPFDQATMVDAAQAEVDEVQRLRAEAGIAALIGPAAPKVFENVDASKVANAAKTLPLVAAELGLDLAAVAPRIASVRIPPPASRTRDDIEWTGSLVGQVSATTSMMMALLPTAIANLAGQAADARGGAPIDNTETYTPQPHDGVSEKVTIRTRVMVRAGGGRVALDLDINSVDTISDTATGREISRLEGNAHGHIDVNGCPDPDGVAEGSYELSLQEELVTSGSSGTGAGDTKVVKAPFKLIDDDTAHLTRIEGNLNITAHAHGPGASGGDPFDWSVGATLSETIPVSGATTAGAPSVQTNGDPTQAQIDRTTGGRRSAEDYLKVLGKETEKFWRSGECIKLKPSRDSGKVKPQEEIKLSVDSVGAFDGQQISAKIKAAFTGKETLDPKDTPVDPPAIFTFKAGQQKDDKGTIDLLQTGKRGIGKKKVEFTVDLPSCRSQSRRGAPGQCRQRLRHQASTSRSWISGRPPTGHPRRPRRSTGPRRTNRRPPRARRRPTRAPSRPRWSPAWTRPIRRGCS